MSGLEGEDWLHLTEDEEVRWSGRPSLVTILPELLAGGVLVAIGIAVVALFSEASAAVVIGLLVVLSGLAIAGLAYLRWWRLMYVITTQEIYVKEGLVSRDVTQIRLDRVQNTTYNQSVLQRLLSIGTVVLYTAGSGTMDIEMKDVPRPERVTGILTGLLDEARRPGAGR
ncbi:PH domain-containing protein [Natronorarus salvus]|uniref:PH domain-containing protein n=1 Tax=Natronorarus salvus TaxID=3117733 RepID=UPI002F26CF97